MGAAIGEKFGDNAPKVSVITSLKDGNRRL